MPVTEITSKSVFDDMLKRYKHVVVAATADWCGPWRAMAPMFTKQADEHGSDAFAFAQFNIDNVGDLATNLGVSDVPVFLFFKDGEKVKTVTGPNQVALTKAIGELAAA